MWPLCTANNFLWLLIPLLIGLLTGLWAWKHGAVRVAPASAKALTGVNLHGAVDNALDSARSYGANLHGAVDNALDSARSYGANLGEKVEAPVKASFGAVGAVGAAAAAALTGIGIPAAVGPSDDLKLVKGIGPKLAELLQALGVRRFDQIAAWGPAEVAKVDEHLGAFRGRIDRDDWITQAKLLARGAFEEFEARFGSLGSNEG